MNIKKVRLFSHIIVFICLVFLAGGFQLPGAFAQFPAFGTFGPSPFSVPGSGFGAYPGFGGGFNPVFGGGFNPVFGGGYGYGASGFGGAFPGYSTGFNYGASGFNPGLGGAFNYGASAFGGYNPGLGGFNYGTSGLNTNFGGFNPSYGTGFNYGGAGLGGFNPGLGGGFNYGASGFGGAFSLGIPSYGFGGMPGGFSPVGLGAGMPYGAGFGAGIGNFGVPAFGMTGGFAGGIPGYGGFQLNPYGFNPYSTTQKSSKSNEPEEPDTSEYYGKPQDIPDLRGHWSGTWEAFATDPNGVVMNDPNGYVIIETTGDIKFHITKQIMTGGKVEGTAQVNNWNVEDYPAWDGDIMPVKVTGWIEKYNKWVMLHYLNIDGDELLSDISNLISDYVWTFNNLRIYDNWFFGQFTVKGTNDYSMVGTFKATKYTPD
ncbi:MAG: hypothetical protein ACMUIL_01950 [bacterium]